MVCLFGFTLGGNCVLLVMADTAIVGLLVAVRLVGEEVGWV